MNGLFNLDLEEVKIRALDNGVSVAELEERAGISPAVLREAGRGGRTTIKSINKLAAALGCSPREIVKGANNGGY